MKTEFQALLNLDAKITSTSLRLPPGIKFGEWDKIGKHLKTVGTAVQFWIGDWLNYGEAEFGEMYSQALDATGYDIKTLQNMKYVAVKVDSSRRREDVDWSSHAEVAGLDGDQQDKVLEKAAKEGLSKLGVRTEVAKLKSGRNTEETSFPKGKFGVIYGDMPWSYDRSVGQGVAVEQYDVMEIEARKNLTDKDGRRVKDLAADNCLLFLWATFPKLQEALDTIQAWGFSYRTVGFTWVKKNKNNDKPFFGIGAYCKSNAEICLLAVKGEPHPMVIDNSVSSIIISPIREHSRKPDEARAGIEKLVGSKIPKVELFAREEFKGWSSWGREITKLNDKE